MEERVYGAAVVAELFRRPDGRIFLVKRKGRQNLTFPTGHMKPVDKILGKTLFRESQEEVLGQSGNGSSISVKEILEVFVRLGEGGVESKIITLYSCEVDENTAQNMSYKETGETLFIWLDPQLAMHLPFENPAEKGIEARANLPLDELAEDGLKVYFEKHPLQKEEGRMIKLGDKFFKILKLIFCKT